MFIFIDMQISVMAWQGKNMDSFIRKTLNVQILCTGFFSGFFWFQNDVAIKWHQENVNVEIVFLFALLPASKNNGCAGSCWTPTTKLLQYINQVRKV